MSRYRRPLRSALTATAGIVGVLAAVLLCHAPWLHLPYFWDETGYYIPAALDFFRHGLLIPRSTLPTGHTPLVTVYLTLAWRAFGFSPLVTRAAMGLVAAATLVSLYALAREVFPDRPDQPQRSGREMALWSCLLVAVSPLFFAQSTLAHLDLSVALFTTLAALALLRGSPAMFAVAATLAVLSKETAIVLLPAAALPLWRRARERRNGRSGLWNDSPSLSFRGAPSPVILSEAKDPGIALRAGSGDPRADRRMTRFYIALAFPAATLALWALYYHHATGYWTGNAEYLQYNLYSTLSPVRMLLSLARRLYEVSIAGFNGVLLAGAVLGWWRTRKVKARSQAAESPFADFALLAVGLSAAYIVMLSVVGGAILPRYLLPIFPLLYLAAVALVGRLARWPARAILLAAAACFVAAWFINPPYPFPYEDNLAYADFIQLHQRAARFLESQGRPIRIATAWPASDELTKPALGYVSKPLGVQPMSGFTADDFAQLEPRSFDVLYLYSREWNPPSNWLRRFPRLLGLQKRYFAYAPQLPESIIVGRFHLNLIAHFERRGQWVRIYSPSP